MTVNLVFVKVTCGISDYGLHPSPAQPAAGKRGDPRLGLPNGFNGSTSGRPGRMISRPAMSPAARWLAKSDARPSLNIRACLDRQTL